ncbi:hypothetical protein FQN53_005410 [Emmonsiellopsis sp. PD_33]|nr:hypothetical protein FQN53_005410 [Emmonsiellopsis sp. PD_33]
MFLRALQCGALYLGISSFCTAPSTGYGFSPDIKLPRCEYPPLIDATSDQLLAGLEEGCFSSVDLVNAYIGRIADVNSTLQVVAELNPEALDIAKALDYERQNGEIRGPMHGLPILIKGNIGITGSMPTTAGSYALVNAELPEDSTIVSKLKKSGVIIIGMAGMSQWANFRSLNSSNGWSAYGGQVVAAYHPEQDPSGSSSGSGVASDLGLSFATLGTETSGSIISPGSKNNVVGIKPTVGLTSRYLVVPISQHQDTVGPIARTVKDAAKLLQVIAGPDQADNYTSAIPFDTIPDYAAACQLSALEGKRLGIPQNVLKYSDPAVLTAFNNAVSILEEAGATIVDNANFTEYEAFTSTGEAYVKIFNADFISDLATFFAQLKTNPNNIRSVDELRTFTQSFPLEQYPDRDTKSWDAALQLGFNNTSPEFWPLRQGFLPLAAEGGIFGALERDNLDAVILPSSLSPSVPAVVGSPIITVPMGAYPEGTEVRYNPRGNLVDIGPGVPMGLSFLGNLWSEESLIGMAYAYEQKSLERAKLKRYIEPTTELGDVRQ